MPLLAAVRTTNDWTRITQADCPMVLEERSIPFGQAEIAPILVQASYELRVEGPLACLSAKLASLAPTMRDDIISLAGRFSALMGVDEVRVRLEVITGNACKKVHTDYTDVRLICTYAGQGTDYALQGADDHGGDCCLEQVPTGWIGLFKGRTFHPDHAPAWHRSPPIAGTGEKRLLLVIDTPLDPKLAIHLPPRI
jgi:hypothetical protein